MSRPETPSDTRGPGTQEAFAQAVAAATTAGEFELAAMLLRELSAMRKARVDGQPLEKPWFANEGGEADATAGGRSGRSPDESDVSGTTDLPEQRSSGPTDALAGALRLAAEAGKWEIVSELSRQLAAMQPSHPVPTHLRVVKM